MRILLPYTHYAKGKMIDDILIRNDYTTDETLIAILCNDNTALVLRCCNNDDEPPIVDELTSTGDYNNRYTMERIKQFLKLGVMTQEEFDQAAAEITEVAQRRNAISEEETARALIKKHGIEKLTEIAKKMEGEG